MKIFIKIPPENRWWNFMIRKSFLHHLYKLVYYTFIIFIKGFIIKIYMLNTYFI